MQNFDVVIAAGVREVVILPVVPRSSALLKVPAVIVPGPATTVQLETVAGILPSGFATFVDWRE